jgi:ribose 5-phosphate isomerase B
MKIAIGCDHAGLEHKERVKEILTQHGHTVTDFGTDSKNSVDYPDFGLNVARAVSEGRADYGVTICWTGNGMAIAANKVAGVRAGLALNRDMAFYTRLHNDANVLSLSQKYIDQTDLEEIVTTFLSTEFEGGRHSRRVQKIVSAERGEFHK